jgi:hypothetical protein
MQASHNQQYYVIISHYKERKMHLVHLVEEKSLEYSKWQVKQSMEISILERN